MQSLLNSIHPKRVYCLDSAKCISSKYGFVLYFMLSGVTSLNIEKFSLASQGALNVCDEQLPIYQVQDREPVGGVA